MDVLRTGYVGKMRTIQGEEPVTVVWHRPPEGAKTFTGPTVMRSQINEDKDGPDQMGEVIELCCWKKRGLDWYNSEPPAPYTGKESFGSDAAWQRGAVLGVDPTEVTNAIGQASCGLPADLVEVTGGEQEGGPAFLYREVEATGGEAEGGQAVHGAGTLGDGRVEHFGEED